MAQVITFEDYTPSPRYDSLPWTELRIEESATEDGVYSELETQALSPVDADPAHPALRSFTTELGTALGYWYQIIFIDADGDESQPTSPIQNLGSASTITTYGTVNELARILKVSAATYAAQLTEVLEAAAGEINSELGLTADLSETWEFALASQVNLERAAEHWHQRAVSFGIIGLDTEGPIRLARDTWDRHAHKLAPLKESWGIA